MVPQGVLCQLLAVLSALHCGGHCLVDHRQQPDHEFVVGSPHDGGMKVTVRLRPVLSCPDAPLHRLPSLQDIPQLLLRGPLAGQPGGLWLEDGPQLKQVPQLALKPLQPREAEVLDVRHFLRHKGPPPPPDLQHSTGGQLSDGLPQGGAAHPQLLGELHLVGELVPGPQRALRHDAVIQAFRRLLGQIPLRHGLSSPFLCAGGAAPS